MLLESSFCPVGPEAHYCRVLKAQTDYDAQVFTGDLSGQSAEGARFLEGTFQRCDLSQVRLGQARFGDTGWHAVYGVAVHLAE